MLAVGKMLKVLTVANVDFIVIGGVAANAQGARRNTFDLDILYKRDEGNHARLAQALMPYHPYLRDAPPGLPFVFDVRTISSGLNFTLITDLGEFDALGEIVGGNYDSLINSTEKLLVDDIDVTCLTLPKLIEIKRNTARFKDFEALTELYDLWEQRQQTDKR